jgi:hypothetical protein
MKTGLQKKSAPTKQIRTGALMTDTGSKTFPTGTSPTTKSFTGTKGAIHGIGKIPGNDLPWTNRQK